MTVEVFRTNVQELSHASSLVEVLLQHFPESEINFDLEDCDKILRVEGSDWIAEQVELIVKKNGFSCEVLD